MFVGEGRLAVGMAPCLSIKVIKILLARIIKLLAINMQGNIGIMEEIIKCLRPNETITED